MKSLVIYYSFSGNTRIIAESIAHEANADIFELKIAKQPPKNIVWKFLWMGKSILMIKSPKLEKIDISFEDYDLIFIGTPVWALTYAPPLRSFFRDFKIKNKQIAMFCTHGGFKGKVLKKIKDELDGNIIVGCIDFVEPFSRNEERYIKNVIVWTKQIVKAMSVSNG